MLFRSVHFRATRAEIREAYQSSGGSGNVRLTMIAGVLLNPKRRLSYDLTPLGRLFFDDEIEEAIRTQLGAGHGILKVARIVGCGSGTVQRVKREMVAA